MKPAPDVASELTLLRDKFTANIVERDPGKVEVNLLGKVPVFVDFSHFPKRPDVQVPKELTKIMGRPKDRLQSLTQWKGDAPFHVACVLEELRNYIENYSGIKLRILTRLANGLCDQAREHHPKEFVGLLRVRGGVLAEYLLAPGMQSSGVSAIFSPSRLGIDRSIIASVHSHPSGVPRPSEADLHMFSAGTQYFHIIIGYPYSMATTRAYDPRGNEIPLEVVSRTPLDDRAC